MKKIIPFVLAIASSTAFAADSGEFYLGLKSGTLDVDVSGLDASTPKAAVIGYRKGSWGAEFEANYADVDYGYGSADFRSFALYGVYRSEGDFYLKAKAGVLREELKVSFASEEETGFSAGIGAGWRLGAVTLEAEYTIVEEDVNFYSLGANFHF
ncbi:porin family protein [Pseudomaricurvus alkylphenolicus]|jgi:hypothetical protein|uniref:outer membrane beta-barrel protein n=1 Tax=Pseudomaricurvus alkylphenolicus TaxID=1306991 RepID=UPI0014216C11|nr:outer membrane beta-barrel protein [Pseudomaricurvus alkylphenolicus]NIB42532.1 porin family protein [Pseudomaricurvus alkylphenolicus]